MDPLRSTASEIRTIQQRGWRGGLRLFTYAASAAALYWAVFHMPLEGDDHAYASVGLSHISRDNPSADLRHSCAAGTTVTSVPFGEKNSPRSEPVRLAKGASTVHAQGRGMPRACPITGAGAGARWGRAVHTPQPQQPPPGQRPLHYGMHLCTWRDGVQATIGGGRCGRLLPCI